MKITLLDVAGVPRLGVVTGMEIKLVSEAFLGEQGGIHTLLAEGRLEDLQQSLTGGAPDFTTDSARFLPFSDLAQRIFCVGINYPKRNPMGEELPPPEDIILFAKVPGTLVGHGAPLERPKGAAADTFDYEGEIAVVIGKPGRHISPDQAMEHVAGLTIVNDGSVRGWQKHSVHAGKNFANSGACGPWMVTLDEIEDLPATRLATLLNGEVVQDTTLASLVFSIPEVIAYVSHTIDLRPGDIISTGSPEGSGATRDPKRFLREDDILEVRVSGVGSLINSVAGR